MVVYGYKNKRTGKFVTGTDRRYNPYHQSYSDAYAPLIEPNKDFAEHTYKMRHMSKDIVIVELELKETKT